MPRPSRRPPLLLLALLSLGAGAQAQANATSGVADPPLPSGERAGVRGAAPTAAPLDLATLQARARELHLADSVAWLRLGHWRPRWGPGVK